MIKLKVGINGIEKQVERLNNTKLKKVKIYKTRNEKTDIITRIGELERITRIIHGDESQNS